MDINGDGTNISPKECHFPLLLANYYRETLIFHYLIPIHILILLLYNVYTI